MEQGGPGVTCPQKLKASNRAPPKFDIKLFIIYAYMHKFSTCGAVGDCAAIVEGYGSISNLFERSNNDKSYSKMTYDLHQATTKLVTSVEIEDSDVSGFDSMIIERRRRT